MEDIIRTVSGLTSLIVTHNKRMRAYRSLSEKSSHEEIKSFCTRRVDQSKQFINNLLTWRSAYGGYTKIDDQSDASSPWHQIRVLFGMSPERALIDRCEQLEREALKVYKTVMPIIPPATAVDLQAQTHEIEKALKRLKALGERTELVGSLVRQ